MTQSHEPDETSAADLDATAPTAADARADMNPSQPNDPHDQAWEEEEEEIEEADEDVEDEDEYEDEVDDGLEEDEEDDGDDDEELLSEELREDEEDIEDGADADEENSEVEDADDSEEEGEDEDEDEVEDEEDGEYEYEYEYEHEHEHAEEDEGDQREDPEDEGEELENLTDDGDAEELLTAVAVVAAAAQDDPHTGGDDDADQQPAANSPRSGDTVASASRPPLPPVAVTRVAMDGPPAGIRRGDDNGLQLLDAMAGRSSVFGFGHAPITAAITSAAGGYLGDGSAWDAASGDDGPLRSEWSDLLAGDDAIAADSLWLCSSADMAVETAIALARRWQSGKRFRTIALLGSDHGRSGTCLTASGRPQLHEGYGPMMAGFSHVPPGDLKAIESAIDDQTACVLLCPVQLHSAARPLDADYLIGVRRLCDQHGLLLVIDETQLMLGGSGSLFSFRSIASIRADMVVVAAGLFAGLPGGLVLADAKVTGGAVTRTDRYPLAAAVAGETCLSLLQRRLPESAGETVHAFAVALAEQIAGFEFVRDLHVTGMTIGIETDIESAAIVRTAARHGLRIESAGPTAIRLQPPLVLSGQDRTALLSTLGDVLTAIEQETVELSV